MKKKLSINLSKVSKPGMEKRRGGKEGRGGKRRGGKEGRGRKRRGGEEREGLWGGFFSGF